MTLAYSPDADDAFAFYALRTGKVDTGAIEFDHRLQDVEALNLRVVNGEVDVSVVSIHAYAQVSDRYVLLPHGLTLGERSGPRLVAREPMDAGEIEGCVVAVPGQLTSAHLALRLFQPDVDVRFVRTDEVMSYVQDGYADAGLLIHAGQLSYSESGLHLVLDVGDWWYEQTGLPLPLGGNVARRALGDEVIGQVCRCVSESIRYALDHREEALDYAKLYAGEMSACQLDEFVGRYVNQRSLEVGEDGRRSVREFLERGYSTGLIKNPPRVEFFHY